MKGRRHWQYSNHNETSFHGMTLSKVKHKTQGVTYLKFDIQKVQSQATEIYTIENTNYHGSRKRY